LPLDKVAYKPFLIKAWRCLDNDELEPALEQFRIAAELIREVSSDDLLLSSAERINSVLRNIKASALTASGWIRLRKGDFSQAAVDFNKATELVPSCRFAARLRSEAETLLEVSQQSDGPLGQLGSSRQMQFESFILKLLGDLYPETAAWDPLDMPQSYLLRGLGRAILGDHHGAISDFSNAIQLNSEFGHAYRSRANIHLELAHYSQAVGDYTEALRLLGNDPNLFLSRARAYESCGEHRNAIEDCDKVLEFAANNLEGRLMRGRARTALGDTDGAIADFSAVLKFCPGERLTLICRSMLYADLGQAENALADCEQLIKNDPQCDNMYVIRGNVRDLLGDRRGAIDDYTQALEMNRYHFVAYLERGAALESLGDRVSATADYNRVLDMMPTDAMAYEWRGHAYRLLGNRTMAVDQYTKSLKSDQFYVHALLSRGEVCAELGDDHGALNDFNSALDIDSCLADAFLKRAWIKLKLKAPYDAIADCRQLLSKFGWHQRNSARAAICCSFALRETNDKSSADQLLKQCEQTMGDHWLAPTVRYLLKEKPEEEVLAQDFDNDRQTIVHSYILMDKILLGTPEAGHNNIDWLVNNRDRTCLDSLVVLSRTSVDATLPATTEQHQQ